MVIEWRYIIFWALRTPSPDDHADFGEILPFIILIKVNFVSLVVTEAGVQDEMKIERVARLIKQMVEITLRIS